MTKNVFDYILAHFVVENLLQCSLRVLFIIKNKNEKGSKKVYKEIHETRILFRL